MGSSMCGRSVNRRDEDEGRQTLVDGAIVQPVPSANNNNDIFEQFNINKPSNGNCSKQGRESEDKQVNQLTNEQTIVIINDFLNKIANNDRNINIADLIIFLINAYYGFGWQLIENVEWDSKLMGDNIILSENKKTITNKSLNDSWNTSYCSFDIDCQDNCDKDIIAQFEIHYNPYYTNSICIGIATDDGASINCNFADNMKNFGYLDTGRMSRQDYTRVRRRVRYPDYGANDTVYMKLSFSRDKDCGLLFFSKNSDKLWRDSQCVIKKTDKIKIAVSLHSVGYYNSSLSLVWIKARNHMNYKDKRVISLFLC